MWFLAVSSYRPRTRGQCGVCGGGVGGLRPEGWCMAPWRAGGGLPRPPRSAVGEECTPGGHPPAHSAPPPRSAVGRRSCAASWLWWLRHASMRPPPPRSASRQRACGCGGCGRRWLGARPRLFVIAAAARNRRSAQRARSQQVTITRLCCACRVWSGGDKKPGSGAQCVLHQK